VKRAFTLIELLVVVAIIAVLAAILFPVFNQAKAAAKASACLSNMNQIGIGVQLYTAMWDDRLFFRGNWAYSRVGNTTQIATGDSQNHYRWWNMLMPYVKTNNIWSCGMDPQPTPSNDYYGVADILRSYIALSPAEGMILSQIENPSDTMVITEKWSSDWTGLRTDSWIEPFNGDFTRDKTDASKTFTAANRHAGQLNASFFDGHAKSKAAGAVQASKDLTGCQLIYEVPFGGTNPPTVSTPSTVSGQPNACLAFTWS
jgi:prepilin-type N-terminal cleavage/methylation domain-containing protein/prepilin-type processing-associated H-X9-DG protein